jgi:hypothetical protein
MIEFTTRRFLSLVAGWLTGAALVAAAPTISVLLPRVEQLAGLGAPSIANGS